MSPRQSTLQGEESDPPPRAACHRDSPHCRVKRVTHPQDEPVGVTATAACHHDSPHCRVQRVTHPQDEPVTGSGRYRHSSMSPRQSTLQGEESDPPPRAACHRDSPHCRVKRVTHPQDEPVGVTATAASHHDSPHCRVKRVTHPQDEPVTGSGRYRHDIMAGYFKGQGSFDITPLLTPDHHHCTSAHACIYVHID
eukprot:Em0003g1059a